MKKLLVGALMMAIVCISTTARAEEYVARFSSRIDGYWQLYAFYGETSDEFKYCSLYTEYSAPTKHQRQLMRGDEVWLSLSSNGEGTFAILLGSPDWNLTVGQEYEVGFSFNDLDREYDITFKAMRGDMIGVSPDITAEFLEELMHSEVMGLWVSDAFIGLYPLTKSANAIEKLAGCVGERAMASQGDTFGGDTFGAVPDAVGTF